MKLNYDHDDDDDCVVVKRRKAVNSKQLESNPLAGKESKRRSHDLLSLILFPFSLLYLEVAKSTPQNIHAII